MLHPASNAHLWCDRTRHVLVLFFIEAERKRKKVGKEKMELLQERSRQSLLQSGMSGYLCQGDLYQNFDKSMLCNYWELPGFLFLESKVFVLIVLTSTRSKPIENSPILKGRWKWYRCQQWSNSFLESCGNHSKQWPMWWLIKGKCLITYK